MTDLDRIIARNLLDAPGSIIFVKDLLGRFVRVSIDCARVNGRTQEEMAGLTDFDLTDHAHATELLADEQRIIATGVPLIDKEEADRLHDEPGTWVETSKFPLRDASGTIIGTFGYTRDVTRWEQAERLLARMAEDFSQANAHLVEVEAQLSAVLNGSMDAIARYDRDLRYQYLNPAGERWRGATLAELIGRTDRESGMPASVLVVLESALRSVLESEEPRDVEFAAQASPNGEESWFHLSLSPDKEATGAVVGVLTSLRDITEIKRAEQVLARQAMHDPLTGLANRYLLMDRLAKALMRLQRDPGRLALFFIDLDRFKDVNDTYGHETGDRVLVEAARRLEMVARREDTVARLGGDEYIVLCDQVASADVHSLAERIVATLAEPFHDGTVAFPMSASVGAMVTDDPRAGAAELLHNADSAMYRAKVAGRNRYEVFDVRSA
ncbi:MAG: diguanylate cyclase [Actinobacteria bacterium]|nr:diguanylate cyclase [Actinomycetota bacterium]